MLRHTAAMTLLQNGVDRAVIALWLGHESVDTTYIYLHADLKLKEQALARTMPTRNAPARFKPDDVLLSFLNGLLLCRVQQVKKAEHHRISPINSA